MKALFDGEEQRREADKMAGARTCNSAASVKPSAAEMERHRRRDAASNAGVVYPTGAGAGVVYPTETGAVVREMCREEDNMQCCAAAVESSGAGAEAPWRGARGGFHPEVQGCV